MLILEKEKSKEFVLELVDDGLDTIKLVIKGVFFGNLLSIDRKTGNVRLYLCVNKNLGLDLDCSGRLKIISE